MPNPFVNHTSPFSVYIVLRTILLLFTLFPLRLILAIFSVLFASLFAMLAILGKPENEPLRGWRWGMMWVARIGARVLLFSLGYWWITVRGKPSPRKDAPIIVPNHLSFIEPIYFAWKLLPCAVAKADVAKIPVVGRIIKALSPILVERESKESRKKCMDDIKERATSEKPWPQVCIFPEGTCCNGKALVTFKNGPFIPGVPVQPVAVKFPFRFDDPSWVPAGTSIGLVVFRLLTSFYNRMEITFLPPLVPTAEERANPTVFALRARNSLATCLDLPTTKHTFADVLLAHQAKRHHENPEKVSFEEGMGSLEELFGLKIDTAKVLLAKFAAVDADKSGEITIDELCEALSLPKSKETEKVFRLFDADGNGALNYTEFVTALMMVTKRNDGDPSAAARDIFGILGKSPETDHLDRLQFDAAVVRVFPSATKAHLDTLFNKVRPKKDGGGEEVTYDHLVAFFKENPEHLAVYHAAIENYLNPSPVLRADDSV